MKLILSFAIVDCQKKQVTQITFDHLTTEEKWFFPHMRWKCKKIRFSCSENVVNFLSSNEKLWIFFHWKCYGQIFPQANCENKAIRKKGLKKLKEKKKLDSKIVEEKLESNFQQFWSRENANETVICSFVFSSFSFSSSFSVSVSVSNAFKVLNAVVRLVL